MYAHQAKVAVSTAILRGLVQVNGPVLLLLFGLPILVPWAMQEPAWFFLAFPLGFILAWLWWSVTIPRWRLWALEHGADVLALYRSAVAVGLMWPRGHFFEKTEIKSAAHARREVALELRYYLLRLLGPDPSVRLLAERLAATLLTDDTAPECRQMALDLRARLVAPFAYESATPLGQEWLYRTHPLILALDRYLQMLDREKGN